MSPPCQTAPSVVTAVLRWSEWSQCIHCCSKRPRSITKELGCTILMVCPHWDFSLLKLWRLWFIIQITLFVHCGVAFGIVLQYVSAGQINRATKRLEAIPVLWTFYQTNTKSVSAPSSVFTPNTSHRPSKDILVPTKCPPRSSKFSGARHYDVLFKNVKQGT